MRCVSFTVLKDDATELSFHPRILKSCNVIEQESQKVYMLTSSGKKLMEGLKVIDHTV